MSQDQVGRQVHQLLSGRLDAGRTCRKTQVNAQVAPIEPPQLLKPLLERCNPDSGNQIALTPEYQHPDSAHPAALLRTHHQRPRSRGATEKRDEIPSRNGDCHLLQPEESFRKNTIPRSRRL
jgi:hypothetical protein